MPLSLLIRRFGFGLIVLTYGAIVTLFVLGGFRLFDDELRDLRFGAEPRGVTGGVVFVDIDSRSLESVGVWPWPRHVHAQILDKLMQLGAEDVVLDIDFSVPSSETEDAALARALEDAGGYAYLAAFQQQRVGSAAASFNLPIQSFRQFADPVTVNVSVDSGGVVRTYPFAMKIGNEGVPSVASVLSGVTGPVGGGFNIDYAIDPRRIARISVADLLADKVPAATIAGKQVIVGASAVELRDYFVVPRHGVLPGALLQALATETLKQNRALQPLSPWPVIVGVVLIGLLALLARRRLPLPAAVVGAGVVSAVAELVALLLQLRFALLADTAPIHAATSAFVLSVLVAEVAKRGRDRLAAMRERDAVRLILDQVITDNFDGVVVANAEGRIVAVSDAAEALLGGELEGRSAASALPKPLAALIGRGLASTGAQGELTLPCAGGERILEYVVTRSEVRLGDRPNPVACLTFRDVTEKRQAEEQLRYLSGHDQLTGALRRTRLIEMIDAVLGDPEREAAVVMVNLRRFRLINDTLGHSQGDILLRQVTSRLRSMGPDAVARLGADSFALLVPGMDAARLKGFCETVAAWLAFPYQLADGHQAIIAASAGATSSFLSGREAEVLLSHADMALSAAKQIPGSNGVMLFAPDMDNRLRERQAMDGALRRALQLHEFTLAYQPQVDLKTGKVVGAEALARWTHPTLGPISPARFVPAAEETGLIVELGKWALEVACAEAASWPGHLRVAVNVSPVQFELGNVVADVAAALERSGLDPRRLELEITEGIFVRNFDMVVERLKQLRALGVSIALDDFGTGYSSLSYIARLPVDKIKIDQSFVQRLPGDPEAAAIVRAVVTLTETLGKHVIAEGIETADQAWMLDMVGCTFAQGYHFGHPVPGETFVRQTLAAVPPLAIPA